MITRVDHVALTAGTLAAATAAFESFGFEVRAGGSHRGLGTHNAIVRFGLDYLELLAVEHEAEALAQGESGRIAVATARRPGMQLLGFAVATSDIRADAERLRAHGVEATLVPMERLRPDGRLLRWTLAVPGGVLWRRPLPFLIEWKTPDRERLAWEAPGRHRNGAAALAGVTVMVRELERAAVLYGVALGLGAGIHEQWPALGAEGRRYVVAGQEIRVLAPTGEGVAARALEASGEGLFEYALRFRSTTA